MLPDQTLFLTQLLTLWAVVDPISHLPLFIGATADFTGAERRRAAVISVLLAFVILAVFGLVGQFLLAEMGVSLLSFQIAGGIMLFLFAVSMVLGDASHTVKQPAKRKDAAARREAVMAVAVYPLATPIIAGPGAMLTIVLLMDNNRYSHAEQAMTLGALATALAGMLVIFLAGDLDRASHRHRGHPVAAPDHGPSAVRAGGQSGAGRGRGLAQAAVDLRGARQGNRLSEKPGLKSLSQ